MRAATPAEGIYERLSSPADVTHSQHFRAFSRLLSTTRLREVWLFLTQSHAGSGVPVYAYVKTL
jgi:hypothetical protein